VQRSLGNWGDMKDDSPFGAEFKGILDPPSLAEPHGKEQPNPKPVDMTRSQQTFWIVMTIAAFGFGILYYVTRLPEGHPYKHCERIIGMDDACTAKAAAREMMRGY
jgi:hypothetical protein